MPTTPLDPERTTPASSRRRLSLRALVVVGAALLLAFVGCATRRDVVVAKIRGRGTQRVYPVSVEQAWSISKAILELEPTEKVEEHRAEGYMMTSDVASALTPSTYIGVFVEPEGTEAKVTIVTRRRTATQGYVSLTEGGFHRKFAELLKLIVAVGPLPSASAADGGSTPADAAPQAADGTDGDGGGLQAPPSSTTAGGPKATPSNMTAGADGGS